MSECRSKVRVDVTCHTICRMEFDRANVILKNVRIYVIKYVTWTVPSQKKWLKRISAVWSECLHPLVINWFIILFPKKLPNWGVHPPFLDPYYKGVTRRQRRAQQRLQLDRYDTAPSAECSRTPPWPHAANCAIPFLDLGKRVHVWYI